MPGKRILMLSDARSVHLQRWVTALVGRGWKVAVLSPVDGCIKGARVIRFEVPGLGLRYPYRWQGRYRAFLEAVARRARARIVHVHYVGPYLFLEETLGGRPIVVSVWGRDVIPEEGGSDDGREQKVRIVAKARARTATTKFLADECRRYCGAVSLPIEVIPFGVETSVFAEAREKAVKKEGVLRIGFVKHLRPKYGAEFLIRAIPRIAKEFPGVEVAIAGEGPLKDSLVALASDLGVCDRIKWLGWVPYERIPALHAGTEVSVMPSVDASESFGVAAVEAQAAGVPVVASDFPGIREAVQDGVGGILIPPRDSEAIAGAVCRLLRDEKLRREMGLAGQKFVREHFEWKDNVDAMEQLYKRVLES